MKKIRSLIFLLVVFATMLSFAACDHAPKNPTDGVSKPPLGKIELTRESGSDSLTFFWLPVTNATSYDFSFLLGDTPIFTDVIEHTSTQKKYSITVNSALMDRVGDYYAFVTAKADPEKFVFSTSQTLKLSVPQGSFKDAPIEIFTAEDFKKINERPLSYHYKLMADIDFKGAVLLPIGYASSTGYFKGSFNGNNHKLSNFEIQSKDMDVNSSVPCIGLFKYLQGAEVCDLTISGARSSSHENATPTKENVGILAGIAQNSVIRNVNVFGSLNWNTPHTKIEGGANIQPVINMGGLIGESFNENTIDNCSFTGSIRLESHFDPDIFVNEENPKYEASCSTFRVGGLVGYVDLSGTASKNLTFDKCFYVGSIDIVGHIIYVGGLIGEIIAKNGSDKKENGMDVILENCYATATIGVNAEDKYVDGTPQDDDAYEKRVGLLIGKSDFMTVINCYANTAVNTTSIKFPSLVGVTNTDTTKALTKTIGFVGYNRGEATLGSGASPRNLLNCYYNGVVNLKFDESLATIGGWPLAMLNTSTPDKPYWAYLFNSKKIIASEELYAKATYVDWDFETIWQENGTAMPTLKKLPL